MQRRHVASSPCRRGCADLNSCLKTPTTDITAVLQSASPAEIAWEAVGGITYLRPTEVATALPAVVTAASCTDWRRQGFHLIPQVLLQSMPNAWHWY